MATLHLMVGLPCSGKTTLAQKLESEHSALRLTTDEWHVCLFGQDAEEPEHDARHNLIETLLWKIASRALVLGTNVINVCQQEEHPAMKKSPILVRLLAVITQGTVIMTAYIIWARPFQLSWGATALEINRPMPGDERRGKSTFLATRAITINDTPENIWPWLIQMGYGRAGFYGYDILENLGSERGIYSADRILPQFQHFTIGDVVPISRVAQLSFYTIEPNKYLVWSEEKGEFPGAFTWALYPIDKEHTRLVSRIGWNYHWSEPSLLALDIFTEFSDHIAVREILQGVKGRVEGHSKSFTKQTIEFVIYLTLFILFIFAQLYFLIRPLNLKKWFVGLASGIAWLLTWYAPIPLWIGIFLGLLVILVFVQVSRTSSQDA